MKYTLSKMSLELEEIVPKHCHYCFLMYLFIQPIPPLEECDIRSVFKWSEASLNTEFSLSYSRLPDQG